MSSALLGVIGFFAIFIITLVVKGIRIVPEQTTVMIERLGKFHRQLSPGLNIIIPMVDAARSIPWRSTIRRDGMKLYVVENITNLDLREQVYDFPSQAVITKDNVGIQVDAVVYFQIIDPKKSVYEILNLPGALETLTQTTLRNVVGEMDLDETLTSRETINAGLIATIGGAADGWGVKVNRVEVQDISPPEDVSRSMEQQMKAERDRRARVTEAEGYKAAEVLRAEGERDAQVATAEGDKLAAIMRAEGEAQAIIRLAEAEKSKLNLVAEAMPQQFAEYLIGTRYMETLDNMAANNNVVWMPHGAQDLGGFIGGYKTLLGSSPVQPTAASAEPS